MKTIREKLQVIYLQLLDRFLQGTLAMTILKTIREGYEEKNGNDDIFIYTLVVSAYNTAILMFANTLKSQGGTINLDYLLNSMKANTKNLFHDTVTRESFSMFIGEVDVLRQELEQVTAAVIELRDKSVAHWDKKHINDPSFFLRDSPTQWEELEQAYFIVEKILSGLGTHLGMDDNSGLYLIARSELQKKTSKVLTFINQEKNKLQG